MEMSNENLWDQLVLLTRLPRVPLIAREQAWLGSFRHAHRDGITPPFPATACLNHMDDARLVVRSCQGDHAAFRQLYDTYAPVVFRTVCRMAGSSHEAEDLTQDVFVRAFERLHTLKDGQAFHAWITRMAVRMAHDKFRRQPRPSLSLDAPPPQYDDGGVPVPEWDEEGVWQIAADTPPLEADLLRDECVARVRQAVRTLSPDHRVVVVLFYLKGLAVMEIAQLIGVPIGTVKSRLARARAELKRKLEGYFDE